MEGDEKACPRCAETIKKAAFVCRFCGHKFHTIPRQPQGRAPLSPEQAGLASAFKVLARLAIAGTIAALVISALSIKPDPAAPALPPQQPPITAELRATCEKAVVDGIKSGLVRGRPSERRIDVDEIVWEALPYADKTNMLAVLACSAFGKRPADLATMEYTVAYGWRSGKRLAMFGDQGFQPE